MHLLSDQLYFRPEELLDPRASMPMIVYLLQSASNDLCHALASVAKRLCTCFVDPKTCFTGVRPIDTGEIPRRIIAKAVLSMGVTSWMWLALDSSVLDKLLVPRQQCMLLDPHSYWRIQKLFCYASNAFNSLNRKLVALHNICVLRPNLVTISIRTEIPLIFFCGW